MVTLTWPEVLDAHKRVAVTGAPKTGKSSLVASVTDRPVIATDAYTKLPWPQIPFAVLGAVAKAGPRFVVEGVQVPRCLRKGMEVDCVVVLTEAQTNQTPGQVALGKGAMGILVEWAKTSRVPFYHYVDSKCVPLTRGSHNGG